ncbi:C6 zinc finger protein [Geosmithia morbida]|uniref:C6 zinc finger protein n=1 Tax=Geosmithia morbida TaxID=1094350 RepID=A0A9P4YUB9_9HYPO|nr:C6 zinc finger protein [Geosmithia morbida]KAF4121929.1 C6 zinc finger protein [Geosmithia morbida]
MTQAVKRACDACHRRKVKCDGINPCRNCNQASLSCTYNAVPQKKGPKGSRAKVISELRETQRQTSLLAKVQSRLQDVSCPPPTTLTPTPGLLTGDIIKECLNFYFENMYAQLPILDRMQIEQQLLYMDHNRDFYCLITSLCAFVILQPGMVMPSGDLYSLNMMPGANIISSQLLVEEAVRVRKGYEYLDAITHNTVATSFFLFGCHYAQEMHDRAWYHLREATTMVHLAGMHKEEHYLQMESAEATRRRRLFWLLYATERAYALQRNRPLTLQPTINLPTARDDPSDPLAHQLNPFVLLVSLFKPFDESLVATWNKARSSLAPSHIASLRKQLNEMAQSYICQDSSFSDYHTNQQWLKSTVWQLTNGSVNDDAMSFQYSGSNMPRDLLMAMASQFQGHGLELLNSGLIERLMEVTHLMIEFLSMQPDSPVSYRPGPRSHMNELLNMVAMSRNGDHRFLPALMSKTAELLPSLVNPMLQNAPDNPKMANIDIFDGFGTAGMAQPPPQMQMAMDTTDYDRKFPVEEYDAEYTAAMDMNGSTPESQTTSSNHSTSTVPTTHQAAHPQPPPSASDINSSFGSPGIMSPGMDYPAGMGGFTMPDIVMSPMAHATHHHHQSTPPLGHVQPPPTQTQQQQQQQQPPTTAPRMSHDPSNNMSQPPPPQQTPQQPPQHMNAMSINAATVPASHPIMRTQQQQQQQSQIPPPLQQRQTTFQLQSSPTPQQMRAVNDFQSLQRPPEASRPIVNMPMTGEIDFSALQ